jgi:HK97 family phage major capsid protein
MVQTLWGKIVLPTVGIPEGTGLTGAFTTAGQFFARQGITLEMTNANEDDFKKNLVAIRCEKRSALALWIGSGFCQITGI